MLMLMLTMTAFAGEIDTPIAPPSAPKTVTTQGQMDTGFTAVGDETSASSVTEAALGVLQSVLSLF